MKAKVCQPLYSRDYSRSDELFAHYVQMLDECDESLDLIVLPESCDVPAFADSYETNVASINKYRDVSLGRVIMYIDVAVVLSSAFLFGSSEVSKVFYGLITLLISSTMLDYVVNSNRRLVQFLIFSKKYDEISEYITKEMHRGVTLLNGVGYYTKEDTKVIVTMMRATEAVEVFRIVHEIDPYAFITQSRVSGVYGAGFDKIKVKK